MLSDKELLVGMLGNLANIHSSVPYEPEVFDALLPVTVSVAVEAVCLRFNSREVEVYLTQRSAQDKAYPSRWHCPGTLLRRREKINNAFSRLEKDEFHVALKSRRFVDNVNLPYEERGHILSMVYLCSLDENTDGLRGKWFPTDQLPEKMIECHRCRIIPAAVGAFVAENTKICR